MKRFEKKTVLITGGASGMGAATARRVVAEGGVVIVADRDEHKALGLAEELRGGPGRLECEAVNLADVASIKAMALRVMARHPAIHGVVNAAGIGVESPPLEEPDPATWRLAWAINVEAAAFIAGLLLPALSRERASIVNLSSDGALKARPNCLVYDATKAAINSVTKSLAAALVDRGVRVNAVAPGWTITEFHYMRAPDPEAKRREMEAATTDYCLMKRYARPEEIAALIVFLLSDESSYTTGAIFSVDGGRAGY